MTKKSKKVVFAGKNRLTPSVAARVTPTLVTPLTVLQLFSKNHIQLNVQLHTMLCDMYLLHHAIGILSFETSGNAVKMHNIIRSTGQCIPPPSRGQPNFGLTSHQSRDTNLEP